MMRNAIESQLLRRLRMEIAGAGTTAKAVSHKLYVSPQTLGRALRGEYPLKVPLLLDVCEVLGVHAGHLLTEAIEEARRE